MKKLIITALVVLLALGGFKLVFIEPDTPHTFEVTVPSFNDVVAFFDEVGAAAEEVSRDFSVSPKETADQAAACSYVRN